MNARKQWHAPPELLRSRPRPVRLTGAGRIAVSGMLALLAGAVASGIWLYGVATRDLAQFKLLEREGVFTPAQVLDLGRTRGKNERYFVVYRYTAAGQLYHRREHVSRRDWRMLRVGATLRVRYLPSHPEFSWMAGYEPRGVPLWLVPIVPASLVLFTLLIGYHLRKQWMLLAEGRPALARVTQSKRIRGSHSSSNRVYYEFRILSGAARSGRYDTAKRPPAEGTTLTILYDRDDPRRQKRYPLSLVRAC
jgi:hypothetical protein